MILRWLTPSWYVAAVHEVNLDHLHARGVRGLIIDLDNTLVPSDASEPTSPIRAWVVELRGRGFRACIVSNNFATRTRAIGQLLQLPVVARAAKPGPWAFRRAMTLMGTGPAETALIGDQLFTDILGGNLLGMQTVLVDPLSINEFPTTRLVRRVEGLFRRRILRHVGEP